MMLGIGWRTRSLRFWLTFGLALAVLPMASAAVIGHELVSHGVVTAFADVAARQRFQLVPTLRLRGALLDAVEPVDAYLDDDDPKQPAAYRLLREQVESQFASLHAQMDRDPEPAALVARARDEWTAADRAATEAISVRRAPGDPHGADLMDRFHGLVASAVDRLGALADDIEHDVAQDHDEALLFYERSEWITGIAGGVSILAMIAAVVTIGRIVSTSVDRLVAGAERFAAGDREHRIDVQVPPELHSVAEEFNRMIGRIRESEAALADLARQDGLTRLLNRRAFDEAIGALAARLERHGGTGALLMLDLDHFKRINDTHGHGIGDEVLRATARVLLSDLRAGEQAFRIGGEEFALLLADADGPSAEQLAERLRRTIAALRVRVAHQEISVTASVGIAVASTTWAGPDWIAAADAALYQSKREGRNRIVVRYQGSPAAPSGRSPGDGGR